MNTVSPPLVAPTCSDLGRMSGAQARSTVGAVAVQARRAWSQADELRRIVPVFALVVAGLAAVVDPASEGAVFVLATIPVAAFALWAYVPRTPLPVLCIAVVAPVVAAQGGGELEPLMFEASLLAFVVARWSPSLATAIGLGLLAATSPVLTALVQDPSEVEVGIWIIGIAFPWVIGRALTAQEELAAELDSTRRQLALQTLLDERRRIARDVHDFVGHTLAALMLHVTGARHVLRRDPDAAEDALRSAEALGRRSMEELRRTFALLRSEDDSAVVAPLPSATEISALVEEARAGGLTVELRTRGDLARIPPGVGVALYRIAQEALANAARHAPDARTVLELRLSGGEVCLEAETSGPLLAKAPDPGRPHYGLIGMRERATALGGEFTAGPSGDGWRVSCRLPLRLGDEDSEGGRPP